MIRVLFTALVSIALALPARAQPDAGPGAAAQLLPAVRQALERHDPAAYLALLAPTADRERAGQFAREWIAPAFTRTVVLDRGGGEEPGGNQVLYVDLLVESGNAGRVATWRLVARQARAAGAAGEGPSWQILDQEVVAAIEGIHRLSLNAARQYAVANLSIHAEDLQLRIPSGVAYVAETADGPAAVVLLGRGQMAFSPAPEAERGQVRIFCGSDVLQTPFDALFIRVSPGELDRHLSSSLTETQTVDPQAFKRADELFQRAVRNSYSLDLGDLGPERWSANPVPGDFLADIQTTRYQELTYTHVGSQPEDVQFFHRARNLVVSAYRSRERLAERGPFYDENEDRDYDVLDYDVNATFDPAREWIEGRGRLTISTRRNALGLLTLRLSDRLAVQSVTSERFGYLLSMRAAGQNQLLVSLPQQLPSGAIVDVEVAYAGRLPSTPPDQAEGLAAAPSRAGRSPGDQTYLYSHGSYWYPQGLVTDYGTATLTLRVPPGYDSVATGALEEGYPRQVEAPEPGAPGWKEYRFIAAQPVRYLGWVIGRFFRVDSSLVSTAESRPGGDADLASARAAAAVPGVWYNAVQLTIDASRSQQRRSRDLAGAAGEVVRFYASRVGDVPYDGLALAFVEAATFGGHSPPYVSILNGPSPMAPPVWSNDPASFEDFPEFFLAHEIAHQWWGQAVGWKNPHDQWMGEALAQYFAALFAEHLRGRQAFDAMVGQMRRWTMRSSAAGPVYLGSRVGQIQGDTRIYTAVVYDKGALVLHMLRRLIGEEAFARGVVRFYAAWRFQKAGTEDLKRAFEAESRRSLDRFFERWVYGSSLPTVRFSYQPEPGAVALRFEQVGELFDVPVTVTVQYADRRSADTVVPLTERVTEIRIPTDGRVRSVEVNTDEAAPANVENLGRR